MLHLKLKMIMTLDFQNMNTAKLKYRYCCLAVFLSGWLLSLALLFFVSDFVLLAELWWFPSLDIFCNRVLGPLQNLFSRNPTRTLVMFKVKHTNDRESKSFIVHF